MLNTNLMHLTTTDYDFCHTDEIKAVRNTKKYFFEKNIRIEQ